jgi:hypothetical protein
MSLDTEVFNRVMKTLVYGEAKWNIINRLLTENEALIAGGAVLAPYINSQDLNVNDLDVYIHKSKAMDFVDGLISLLRYSFIKNGNYIKPAYDQSFFRKNNIIARFRLYLYEFPPIDIMIIPDEIPILSVVTNFDLTFCEIWYDGRTVSAVDPVGILAKTGKLKKDYVNSFLLYLNQFTIRRVLKYVKKGFTITYDSEKIRNTFLKQSKNVTSPEEWVVYKLYNFMLRGWRHSSSAGINLKFILVCQYYIGEYTLANLERILPYLKENLQDSFWEGLDNKTLYTKIFVELGIYDHERQETTYPRKYMKYIKDVLDISSEDIEEFYNGNGLDDELIRLALANDDDSDDDDNHSVDHSDDDDDPVSDDDPVLPFEFEEADDVDEREINHKLCKDLFTTEETHIQEYLSSSDDTFLLISKDSGGFFYMICYDKEYISQIISDKANWYYECKGDILDDGHKLIKTTRNEDKALIKIPIHTDGMIGYIRLIELRALLDSNHKIYYLYSDGTVSHSITWGNSRRFGNLHTRNAGSNCNNGSQIFVYKLKLCRNEERCLKSIGQQQFETPAPDSDMFSPNDTIYGMYDKNYPDDTNGPSRKTRKNPYEETKPTRLSRVYTHGKIPIKTISITGSFTDDKPMYEHNEIIYVVNKHKYGFIQERINKAIENEIEVGEPIIVNIPTSPEFHAFLLYIEGERIMISDWGGFENEKRGLEMINKKKNKDYDQRFLAYSYFMEKLMEKFPGRKIEYYEVDKELYDKSLARHDSFCKKDGSGGHGGCSDYVTKWAREHSKDYFPRYFQT